MIFLDYTENWYKILASRIDAYTVSNYTIEELSQSLFFDGHFHFEELIHTESKRKMVEDLIGIDRFYKVLIPNLSNVSSHTYFDISFSIEITEEEALYIEMKELPFKVTRIDNFNPIIPFK